MIKKLSELSKDEKILLLKAVADKEIEPDQINEENTLFAIKRGDFFTCVMMAASPGNEGINIVCLGEEAKAERKTFDGFVELPRLNYDRIESSGLYKCQETGEELTEEEVQAKTKGYQITIRLVDDLKKPASGYMLCPKTKETFIGELQAQK